MVVIDTVSSAHWQQLSKLPALRHFELISKIGKFDRKSNIITIIISIIRSYCLIMRMRTMTGHFYSA